MKSIEKEKVGQYLKYILGILFLAFVGSSMSLVLLEIFGYDKREILGFDSFYVLWAVWLILLHLFLLNTEPTEYPQHKETVLESKLSKVGNLCGIVLLGFLYGAVALFLLGVLLQLTLEIDITEFDTFYRLVFLFWTGGIIGLHVTGKVMDLYSSKK